MAVDHLSAPVPLPDLTHLSYPELTALRSFVSSQMKEARKVANKALQKHPTLRSLWMSTLSIKSNATDEERHLILDPFHCEILKYPEAYWAYANANALHVMDSHVWTEMVRRSKVPA